MVLGMNEEAAVPEFGTFERSALPEQICTRFLSLIEDGVLRPGDRLPPERELAATMQVSRPSLREALRALSMMNVIEMRQGAGTFVTSLEPALLVEHLDFVFSLDDSTFLQLFEARRILEPGIAAVAAQRITEAEIAGLQACLARGRKQVEHREAFVRADLELHQLVASAAGNPILSRFMSVLGRLGIASRRRTVEIAGVATQVVGDHEIIVAALSIRDPEAAYQAMLQHLENVQRRLRLVTGRAA